MKKYGTNTWAVAALKGSRLTVFSTPGARQTHAKGKMKECT